MADTWIDPLELARRYAGEEVLALLYASRPAPDGSWRSMLAVHPEQTITSGWEELAAALTQYPDDYWIGYLGYELGETVAPGNPAAPLAFPPMQMTRFREVWVFDHHLQTIHPSPVIARNAVTKQSTPPLNGITLSSNLTRAQYLQSVADTVQQIEQGEFYQANITRKFYGELAEAPAPFDLFCSLVATSNPAFSAYLKWGDRAVLSASPESFLSISAAGKVTARPIKGTARRSGDAATDTAIRAELAESTKNRAENLMIVDLMRHDLAQSCVTGSVQVEELCAITEHPHLYHMVSTISGQKRPEVPSVELIRRCFPPGSMTGAPKQAAIHWCEQQEGMQRGVYSGALGWMHGDGSAELSVVIRTLLLQGNRFEFQVGGGIVADSTPESEWQETLTKATGIAKTLGIPLETLAAI